ncbi:MAG: isoprenylcysteine carboxylmethyltransferase family protein [Methanomassiliicoccales archaeon]|nr:isoprenylcysteine carboxylmethyltransferase family protein [Methanomassiliicoccales archaeon]
MVVWIAIYAVFLLFIPFCKKSQIKPDGTCIAFVVAFALEMFGIPFSMYALGWTFGITLPEGVLWGHTLDNYIGLGGMCIGVLVSLIGLGLVIMGWRQVHKGYWSKEEGDGKLITPSIYGYIRHPQYTGFFLITLGMMLEWATLPLIILYTVLLFMYYRLVKREEKDMVDEFGEEYEEYRRKTKMFIPGVL